MNKINDVPFFRQLYNFYASQTSVLSKKIRSDFKSNKNFMILTMIYKIIY